MPGETALITFGVLAGEGHYSIVSVIVVAAAGAIISSNLGYWLIGRKGGRALFRRWRWLNRYSDRVLPRAESIMARHGGAAGLLRPVRRGAALHGRLGRRPFTHAVGESSCSGTQREASSGRRR